MTRELRSCETRPIVSAVIDLLAPTDWQMTFGERAALEGILSQLKPALSIEIGTAEGGSLRRIATHSEHVHSFDLVEPAPAVRELANVTLHTGDSHVLLSAHLTELESAHANVDFALVDGDHTAEGVRQDVVALLSSDAVGRCVILIHDTANEVVREGLERVGYHDYAKIKHLDLDFIAGHLSSRGAFHHQLWGGLGVIVVDDSQSGGDGLSPSEFYSSFELFAALRDALVEADQSASPRSPREVILAPKEREGALVRDLHGARAALAAMQRSASWRLTAPLRMGKRTVQERRRK